MTNSSTGIRTYKYRLYPTPEQAIVLGDILDSARFLYNHALAYRRKRWVESRHGVTYNEQSVMWRLWRNEQPKDNPLRLLNMSAGQQVLRRLDQAFSGFFQGKSGYPRFKKHRGFNSIDYVYTDGLKIRGNRLYIQNVGLISVRWHRALPEGVIKQVTILRKPSGWYACFAIEINIKPIQSNKRSVGIDVGIHHALALSDGTIIDSPKHFEQSLVKLRVLQRRVSRRKKGSKRRAKAVRQMSKYMEHIASQRRDWWHKVTTWLVNEYGTIVLEDLSLTFMIHNRRLSRAAYDVGLGIFDELLGYKAIEAGVEIIKVNPAYTSQMCSGCGELVEKDLSERMHCCPNPECGLVLDRDVNAAIVISKIGLGQAMAFRRQRRPLGHA